MNLLDTYTHGHDWFSLNDKPLVYQIGCCSHCHPELLLNCCLHHQLPFPKWWHRGSTGICLPIWASSQAWKFSTWGHRSAALCFVTGLHEPSAPLIPRAYANVAGLRVDFCLCIFREGVIFCLTLHLFCVWSLWGNANFHIQLFTEITVGPAVRTIWHHGGLCKIWANGGNRN